MERVIATLKIVLLLILIAILSSVLVLFINKDLNFDFNFGTRAELIYDKNIEEEFDKINIRSDSLDIKFIKSSDNIVNVKVYDRKENEIKVNVEDNTLNIASDNNSICIFCFMKKREAVISLPDNIYDLIIKTGSGDITSNTEFNSVNIESTSGDIEFNNVKDLRIKVTSGDILVNEVDNLSVESTSGDVEINKINKYLNIETISGDIDIKDLSLAENSRIRVTSGDVTIFKSSENIYYNAKTTSGNVRINNNDRFANIELTINTISGDVMVKN